MNIDAVRRGGSVRRYHVQRTIGHQTVAEHSWGVAILLMDICPAPSADLLRAAMLHDVAEGFTGDVPATAKWESPALCAALDRLEDEHMERISASMPKLSPDEMWYLKTADMLELMWYCHEQRTLGNTGLIHVWNAGFNYLMKRFAMRPDISAKAQINLETLVTLEDK